jgi:electron transfer flavoprotein beta subunit
VLTLGPDAAAEQLRDALAVGIERAILLVTGDGEEWDAVSTAAAIVDAVRAQEAAGTPFDLIFFGTEAADTGDYQVGIRVATALDRPIVSGVKQIAVEAGRMTARREATGGGWEVYEVPLPAVVSVREGLNLPRYPSVPGRLRAKRQPIERVVPSRGVGAGSMTMERLRLPVEQERSAEILGHGPDAAPRVVEILRRLGAV